MARRAKSFTVSLGFAWDGVRYLFATQRNARIQGVAALSAIVLALLLRLAPAEWAVLLLTIGVVLAMEAVNTAIEALTDLVSPGSHPLAARTKDLAAAAVLLAAISAATVGAWLFVPRLVALASPSR